MSDEEYNTDPRFYTFRNAIEANKKEAARLLKSDPELIHVRNSIGETVFHWFIVENHFAAAKWLLSRGANINTQNDFGNTPLMEAAYLGYLKMCKFLLSQGAEMTLREQDGDTVVVMAARSGRKAVLKLFLERLPAGSSIHSHFGNIEIREVLFGEKKAIINVLRSHGLTLSKPRDAR